MSTHSLTNITPRRSPILITSLNSDDLKFFTFLGNRFPASSHFTFPYSKTSLPLTFHYKKKIFSKTKFNSLVYRKS